MQKIVLCVMDGIGVNQDEHGNAFKLANTPNIDRLLKEYPHSLLEASGEYVGLPQNQMGNSEVGHMHLGAGRIVYSLYELINKSIKENTLKENKVLQEIIAHVENNNSRLHLSVLLSDGGVHAHINHLLEIIKICQNEKIDIILHPIGDGRDVNYKSLLKYLKQVSSIKIGSVAGRYYAMDRNNNFDRTKLYYEALTGNNLQSDLDITEYIKESYEKEVYDEYIYPASFNNNYIKDNDAFLFVNFRSDRARQLMKMMIDNPLNLHNVLVVGMTEYRDNAPYKFLFSNQRVSNSLGQVLSQNNLIQYRLAETEKYAHVTYYFDGGTEDNYPGYNRKLIPSKNNYSYAQIPQMSAHEITADLVTQIASEKYDFILVNYANGDMVGHTGDLKAAIIACETVDECLKEVVASCQEHNYLLLITADHGNCEKMLNENNEVVTSHTTNPVYLIAVDHHLTVKNGSLSDIAPTILNLMSLDIPQDMTGKIIIERK